MKKASFVLLLAFTTLFSKGQQWSLFPFQSSPNYSFSKLELWNNQLVLSGGGEYINDTIKVNSFFFWDGQDITPFFGEKNYDSWFKAYCFYQDKFWIGGSITGFPNYSLYDDFYLWDGDTISTLPIPHPDRMVTSILAHNGNVYLGGPLHYGGIESNLMSYWDGTALHQMNGGLSGDFAEIKDMAIFKGELYVSGAFTQSQNGNPFNIARWDGQQWHDLDTGLAGDVWALAVDSEDNYLYAAGSFTFVGGNNGFGACGIARWDGQQWSKIPLKTDDYCALGIFGVRDIEWYHGELYAAMAGGIPDSVGESDTTLMKWNGVEWKPIMGILGFIEDLQVYNDELIVAGSFEFVNGNPYPGLARWYSPPDTTLSVNKPLINKTAWLWPPQPNPNSGRVLVPYFNPAGKASTITITSNEGKTLASHTCKAEKNYWELNTTNYAKGIYYISMVTDGWKKQSQKMVVE